MIVATHKKIAREVYHLLPKDLRIRIHKKTFIAGSFFPDINLKHSRKHHSFEKTGKTVHRLISEIIGRKLSRKSLSHKLGIVCHYISDYCCAYHSNYVYKKKSLVEHLKYEYKLDKKFDSVVKSFDGVAPFNLPPEGFIQNFERMVSEKMQNPPNMEADILNAVTMSYFYLVAIISACPFEQRVCA